jgi:hypothetical protein
MLFHSECWEAVMEKRSLEVVGGNQSVERPPKVSSLHPDQVFQLYYDYKPLFEALASTIHHSPLPTEWGDARNFVVDAVRIGGMLFHWTYVEVSTEAGELLRRDESSTSYGPVEDIQESIDYGWRFCGFQNEGLPCPSIPREKLLEVPDHDGTLSAFLRDRGITNPPKREWDPEYVMNNLAYYEVDT